MEKHQAIILTVRKALEFNLTTIYRWAFLGEVADAIQKTGFWEIDIFDGAVNDAHLDDYLLVIKKNYDLLLFYTDPHTAKEVFTICEYVKVVSPNTKILIYGRATAFIPQYFERDPFDAVHINGDRELVISDYALFLANQKSTEELTGLSVKINNKFVRTQEGKRFAGNNWYFPLLSKLPIDEYKKIYEKKKRKFEYAISVSKGCKYNCKYCEASVDQGIVDRRRDPIEIIQWINSNIKDDEWNIQLWSSNFFADKNWIRNFCAIYNNTDSKFTWRCVGNFKDIDENIMNTMANSGCYEIAIGAESLFFDSEKTLKGSKIKLFEVLRLGKKYNIIIKCLLMAGIPGQNEKDIAYTVKTLLEMGIPFRYTLYTPLNELTDKSIEDLDQMNLSIYDRRTFLREQDKKKREIFMCTLAQDWEKIISILP
jgi:anaerobic magnesium-protoporphyrin IX monomethyl ester cyclase